MSARRVVIAGASTRAAAESAARAGYDVTAIDAFGDIDQHPAVDARSVPGTFTVRAAVNATRDVPCDAVAYLAPFENHPDGVSSLATNRRLWGNPPDVLIRARDPDLVAQTLRRRGFSVPAVHVPRDSDPSAAALTGSSEKTWLIKPLASGGGHGIRPWNPGQDIPRGSYLHEFVDGVAGSVAFVAAGGAAVPLGVFRQLVGDSAFGAAGFRYCGNILDPQPDDAVADAASILAATVAATFNLVGVNGIDFVTCAGVPWPVEINPRWCASMELVERAFEVSVFRIHARACEEKRLPVFDRAHAQRKARRGFGKAIVFARKDAIAGDTRAWLDKTRTGGPVVRDVPRPGTRLRAGRPICTVIAEAPDAAACYAALVEGAARIYADLAAW